MVAADAPLRRLQEEWERAKGTPAPQDTESDDVTPSVSRTASLEIAGLPQRACSSLEFLLLLHFLKQRPNAPAPATITSVL